MEDKKTSVFDKSIDFLGVLKKCWYYIIIVALLFGFLSAYYTTNYVDKSYSSTVKFYVVTDRSTAHYLNTELDAAKSLIDSYSVVIKNSDAFLRKVAEHTGLQYAPSQLRSMISVATIGSEAFYVKVSNSDPNVAYQIATAIEQIGPDEMVRFVEAGNVKVLNSAKLAVSPESPNVIKNIVIAMFLGAILIFALFFLSDFFDTRIHSEDDLQKFEIPILGSIPTMPNSSEIEKKARKEKKK